MVNAIKKVTVCRACKGRKFKKWFDLGRQPLANALVKKPYTKERKFPLAYMYCTNCELVQTTHVVNPKLLFDDYLYHSSTSDVFRKHFEVLAKKEFSKKRVKKGDLVVDIGSNDGILLKPFQKMGAYVLGIEPAQDIATKANDAGIETFIAYFNAKEAKIIKALVGQAKLITATNVFAHVDNLDEILKGVKLLLAENGRFMIEVAYMPTMVEDGTFDLLYHEHLCAWHLYPLQVLFARHGMYVDDVEGLDVHGGSMRVYAKFGDFENGVTVLDGQFTRTVQFKRFPSKIKQNKKEIISLLKKLKKEGKKIIGYGAPAKMSTITNYLDIGPETIDYIIDDSPVKQGLYSPSKNIKIVPSPEYINIPGDYMFIFAWNFADSIVKKAREYGYKGKFIVPFPKLKII